MTNSEAINWIINISADIGKAEHRDLWHYEQALSEIKEMLESEQPDVSHTNVGDTISRQSAIDEIARWIGYLDDDMIGRIQLSLKRLPSAQSKENCCVHIDDIYRLISGHSNYHGDNILAALTCLAEGKEVPNPIAVLDAQPKRKKGEWILTEDDNYEYCTCSECGYQNGENWMNGSDIPFCAVCGADMRGDTE